MANTDFHGIYPILYTFFDEAGGVDAAAMRRQVDACINAGAHGIAILGIVSEFMKMNTAERRTMMEVTLDAVGGRLPVAVTVAEPSVHGQIEFLRAAEAAGAAWTILQPPQFKGIPEGEMVRFFGAVAEKAERPVAIQNNPVNLDVWLTNAGLKTLNRNHPNVCLLKGEGPAMVVQACVEETDGVFDIFTGLGGREMTTTLPFGCVGCIPAPDCIDVQCRIYEAFRAGDMAEAERLHRSILPMIQFALHSPAHMLTYGKMMFAERAGIEVVHHRAPAIPPTDYTTGLAMAFARELPRLD